MMQASDHHVFRHLSTPAAEGFHHTEVEFRVLCRGLKQRQQPVTRFGLMTETGCHHEIGLHTVALDQLINDRPTPFSQHSEFFAEGPAQLNRKAGGVGLPQPVGLQWSPA